MWGKSSVSPLPPPSPPTSLDYKSEPKLSSSLPSALREKCLSKSHFVDNWIISPVKWGWLALSVVNIVVNMFCLSLLTVQLEYNLSPPPSPPPLPSLLLCHSIKPVQISLYGVKASSEPSLHHKHNIWTLSNKALSQSTYYGTDSNKKIVFL